MIFVPFCTIQKKDLCSEELERAGVSFEYCSLQDLYLVLCIRFGVLMIEPVKFKRSLAIIRMVHIVIFTLYKVYSEW